jgi:hypothetical protein
MIVDRRLAKGWPPVPFRSGHNKYLSILILSEPLEVESKGGSDSPLLGAIYGEYLKTSDFQAIPLNTPFACGG